MFPDYWSLIIFLFGFALGYSQAWIHKRLTQKEKQFFILNGAMVALGYVHNFRYEFSDEQEIIDCIYSGSVESFNDWLISNSYNFYELVSTGYKEQTYLQIRNKILEDL